MEDLFLITPAEGGAEMTLLKETRRTDSKIHKIDEFVAEKLDGAEYEQGVVEDAAATANNCRMALSRLIKILADKGALTGPEVYDIADGFGWSYRDKFELVKEYAE